MTKRPRLVLRAAWMVCMALSAAVGGTGAPGLALANTSPHTLGASAPSAPASGPATFTVNSLTDHVADFTNEPNFDTCRTHFDNSTCTLRAASGWR